MNTISYVKRRIKEQFPDSVKLWIIGFKIWFARGLKKGNRKDVSIVNYQILSHGRNATFFGYHDKTPFSADGSKILAMTTAYSDRKPDSECTNINIGYFYFHDEIISEFITLDTTNTWCWQQGCMLQWLPGDSNNCIVYNKLVNNEYGSVVFDITTNRIIEEFDYPIYSLDPKGRYAISLNFSRLGRLRPGYGYGLLPDPTLLESAPREDGLFLHCRNSQTRKLIVRISDLAQNINDNNSVHYVNHSTFSPDGNSIVFFHLWNLVSGKRRINLYCYSLKSDSYSLIEESRIVSHYCWIDSTRILASTKESNSGMMLTIYDIENNTREDVFELIDGDTHPMVSPINENLFVIDSYPDKIWNQNLYLFYLKEKTIKKISSFYSPRMYRGQVRCDLHPRWDRQGKYIVVDSADKGRRRMYLVSI